jgi:O-antigen ligase
LIIIACTAYAYAVNARRPEDDPKKRSYEVGAIFLAPITFPLLITFALSVFVLRAILFAIYLGTLTIFMVFIRKPFLFAWLHKIAMRIGEPLLKINTTLIRLAFAQWSRNPQTV